MKTRTKRIRNYIFYSIVMAVIFGFISPMITRYIGTDNLFDWQWFTWAMISAIFFLFIALYFPKFRKAGDF